MAKKTTKKKTPETPITCVGIKNCDEILQDKLNKKK